MRSACSGIGVTLLLALVLAGCGAATSATHDDASISTRIKIALLSDPQVGVLRIDAKTFQGVATLSGTVRSQADVERAIAVARRIGGVKDVKSELKIEAAKTTAANQGPKGVRPGSNPFTSPRSRSDRVARRAGRAPPGRRSPWPAVRR
jgi:hypothetical protein